MPATIRVNLTGQRFGRLVVLAYAHRNARSQTFWLCRCDCGNTHTVISHSLQKGDTQSCGCFNSDVARARLRQDFTGYRFGRLVVEAMGWAGGTGRAHCVCDCGRRTVVYATNLTRGITQSCGCLHAEVTGAARRIDLTGHTFGRLTVLAMTWKDGEGWAQCRCMCGSEPSVRATKLATGHTQSCGCLQAEATSLASRKDLTGLTFGRLTVTSMSWGDGPGKATCLCTCGRVALVRGPSLLSGNTQSCGCLKRRTSEEKQARKRLAAHARLSLERGLPYDFLREDEILMLDYWHHRCAVCGALADLWRTLAWDHWIPLRSPDTLGTIPGNILPLCHAKKGAATFPGPRACNNSKGAKDPVAWLTTRLGARKAAAKLRAIAAYFAVTRRHLC